MCVGKAVIFVVINTCCSKIPRLPEGTASMLPSRVSEFMDEAVRQGDSGLFTTPESRNAHLIFSAAHLITPTVQAGRVASNQVHSGLEHFAPRYGRVRNSFLIICHNFSQIVKRHTSAHTNGANKGRCIPFCDRRVAYRQHWGKTEARKSGSKIVMSVRVSCVSGSRRRK